MEYREIVSVTGLSGLFQLLTTKSDGAIVRNIADKSTKFISARQHNVTPLDSIEVYTIGDNVRLIEVFRKMMEHEEQTPPADPRSNDSKVIKTYFKTIFPEFDEERVYVSDMKKMLRWFDLLKENNLLQLSAEAEEGVVDAEVVAEGQPAAEAAVAESATEQEPVSETGPAAE